MLENILLTTIKNNPRGSSRIGNHVENSEAEVQDSNFSTGPDEEDNISQCASGFVRFLS